MRKMNYNEGGSSYKLLGTTSGYTTWNNTYDKFKSMELLNYNIKVYKDVDTGQMSVKPSTRYTSSLEKTNQCEPEGFFYAYRDISGNDIAVKTIKIMK